MFYFMSKLFYLLPLITFCPENAKHIIWLKNFFFTQFFISPQGKTRLGDDRGGLPKRGDERNALPKRGDERNALPKRGDKRNALPKRGDKRNALPKRGDERNALPNRGGVEWTSQKG